MPMSASDRKLLAIAALVLAALLLAMGLLSPGERQDQGFPSSYNTRRRGGKAAFLLLKQSGYDIVRWEKPPGQLPADPAGTALILAEPRRWPEDTEANALRKFVAAGGTLLAAGVPGEAFAPNAHIFPVELRPPQTGCLPAAPSRLSRGGPIILDGAQAWSPFDVAAMVHFRCGEDAVVVSYPLGRGQVIWWASAWPLTNVGIREKNNLDLLVNSLGPARRVLWDEHFLGSPPGPWSYAESSTLNWALLDAGALALLILATFARRSGPLVPLPAESRLSPLEFVDTLGQLYQRAGASQVTLEITVDRFRQLLARRYGLHGPVSAEMMVRTLEARRVAVPGGFESAWRRCEEAAADPNLTQREALRLVQQIQRVARQIQAPPAELQEKKNASDSPAAVPHQEPVEQGHHRAAGVR